MSPYYQQCCNNIGKPVSIRTLDEKEHRGVIRRVTPTHVYLDPLPSQSGGFGSGYYSGPYQPWEPGFGYGIALGAIGTLAILPWFFI